ncbi:hypothetical protein [Nonomuraea sp. NPDC003804]
MAIERKIADAFTPRERDQLRDLLARFGQALSRPDDAPSDPQ